jgi:hypothetical protein
MAGFVVGLVITILVVFMKPSFLVDTPRSEHSVLLVAMFAVPTGVGGLVGIFWPQFFGGRGNVVPGGRAKSFQPHGVVMDCRRTCPVGSCG